VVTLLGRHRGHVPVYGSGGFTTYADSELEEQVRWWHDAGTSGMKIKIGEDWGSNVARDLARVGQLRALAGHGVELMVDANGGYTPAQARRVGAELDALGVVWFEEPVSSDDIAGLTALRSELRCDVAAGEYAADLADARLLLGAVDCLQLDVTRCGGYTGFMRAAALAQANQVDVSAHCAPAVTLPVAAAVPNLRHVEWFADHVRLEPELVDGIPEVRDGAMALGRAPGHGYQLAATAADFLTRAP
jgi:L-alanine-DL-glutamate epimerase-like enolase superfamily enzyme